MSETESADLTPAVRRAVPEVYADDTAGMDPSDQKKPEREGLPPGYRMRADAHYVEQLSSRRADRSHSDATRSTAKRAESSESENLVEARERRDPRDRRADKVLAQLAEDMATIESLAGVLGHSASPMARRASLDVIKAQAWRASWLLRANAVLDGVHRASMRPRQVAHLLGQVRDGFAAEGRLSGFTLHTRASDWGAEIVADEHSLLAAMAGAVIATLGLVAQIDRAELRLTVVAASGDLQMIEVSQDDVELTAGAAQRFFDPSWADRPGGFLAGLGAATARAVVQQHGGEAHCFAGDHRGSTLRLTFTRPS